jgi:hypothetical protein
VPNLGYDIRDLDRRSGCCTSPTMTILCTRNPFCQTERSIHGRAPAREVEDLDRSPLGHAEARRGIGRLPSLFALRIDCHSHPSSPRSADVVYSCSTFREVCRNQETGGSAGHQRQRRSISRCSPLAEVPVRFCRCQLAAVMAYPSLGSPTPRAQV